MPSSIYVSRLGWYDPDTGEKLHASDVINGMVVEPFEPDGFEGEYVMLAVMVSNAGRYEYLAGPPMAVPVDFSIREITEEGTGVWRGR